MQNIFKTPAGTELPLLDLRGKSYLQVAHRLVWFREIKPDWSIVTEIIERNEKFYICKATVLNEQGRIMSTAHKREDVIHFQDAMEKSETGAVGRALAMIGYGTQFAPDLDEGERIVDSPVERKSSNGSATQTMKAGVGCELCGEDLILSKAGTGWYCKNFKDTSKGEHARFPASKLAEYREYIAKKHGIGDQAQTGSIPDDPKWDDVPF